MIIEYNSNYAEETKDLLLELQQYLSSIDKEKYSIIGDNYREKYFKKTMKEVKQCNGKILLYKEKETIVGLVVGIVNNDKEITFDIKKPKIGRITEIIVTKEYRGKRIGKKLLHDIRSYLKSIGCKKIMIAVFYYNENALKFYTKEGYHVRLVDMIED